MKFTGSCSPVSQVAFALWEGGSSCRVGEGAVVAARVGVEYGAADAPILLVEAYALDAAGAAST